MADRKVYVNITIPAIIRVDEGVEISDVMAEVEAGVELPSTVKGADLEIYGPFSYEVTDSK